jgi:hypothetical protein
VLLAEARQQQAEERRADRARIVKTTQKILAAFCLLANREIFNYYGSRASCVFSTAVVCDVLRRFNIQAEPLRVTAAVFPSEKGAGCILGSEGDGTRGPRSGPDMWKGHLVSLVEEKFLVDTTLDQVRDNHPGIIVEPCVIHLPDTEWFRSPCSTRGYHWTVLTLFPGSVVRYSSFPRQNGWKNAGDFRPCRRKKIVERLVRMCRRLTG